VHRINRITRINHDLLRATYLMLRLRTIGTIGIIVCIVPA
jgi:hypothetical protein